MKRRDSLAPRMAHKCPDMPSEFPPNQRGLSDDNGTPDELFYPNMPIRIILHNDGVWYIVLQEEFCIPIDHCPWCGEDLNSSAQKPLPPPPAVEVEEEVPYDDDEPAIEIEAE